MHTHTHTYRLSKYSLEEWHNLGGKDLSCPEPLGVQHHLGNQLPVWLCHRKAGGRGSEGGKVKEEIRAKVKYSVLTQKWS